MAPQELRALLARVTAKAIIAQDGMYCEDDAFELADDLTVRWLDQGETDFGKVADAIIAVLAIETTRLHKENDTLREQLRIAQNDLEVIHGDRQ